MKRWALGACVALLGWALAPHSVQAQQEAESTEDLRVREGSNVRIRVFEDPSALSRLYPHTVYEGTVTSLGSDAVQLAPTKPRSVESSVFPWTDIERLEVGVPTSGSFWRGALIGAPAVGAGLALIGMAACGGGACAFGDLSSGEAALLLGGVGAGVGFVLGGVLGASSERLRWERVSVEGVRIRAGTDGTGLALAVPLRL